MSSSALRLSQARGGGGRQFQHHCVAASRLVGLDAKEDLNLKGGEGLGRA